MNQLFALSLGIAAMVFAASQSNAQTAGPACAARAEVVQALASKYGETRQAMGLAATTQLMEIYASPKGSWSLTVTLADGTSMQAIALYHVEGGLIRRVWFIRP